MYEAKKGYSNWYFNQLEQDKLLAAFKKHGDFSTVPGKWVIDGKFEMADRNGPMKIEVVENAATAKVTMKLNIETTLEPLKQTDVAVQQEPIGSGGLMMAMYHYHRFLTLGPKGFEGLFAHGGYEPFYPYPADGSAPKSLAKLRVDCAVILTKHGSTICKWYFSQKDHTLLGFETYIDKDAKETEDRDPCEVYLYDYKDVNGRKLPHKMEVRFRDKRYATLTVAKFDDFAWKRCRKRTFRNSFRARLHPTPRKSAGVFPPRHHHVHAIHLCHRACCGHRAAALATPSAASAADPFADVVEKANKKLVKVFGAGGFSRLNNFGTGIVISKDGYILTVASQLLDTSDLVVHLYDGQRLKAQVIVTEPELDIALIKIKVDGKKIDEPNELDLDYFDFDAAVKRGPAAPGDWVIGLSNTFEIALRDEPLSVQRGVISAYTKMAGRRGIFEFPYTGDVYIVDAITNNPGAAGGALLNRKGELIGIIGRELKNSLSDTWMNYAIPVGAKTDVKQLVVQKDKDGKPVKDKDGKEVEEEKTRTISMPEFVTLEEGRVQAHQDRPESADRSGAATTASSSCRTSWNARRRTSRTWCRGRPRTRPDCKPTTSSASWTANRSSASRRSRSTSRRTHGRTRSSGSKFVAARRSRRSR